MSIESRALSSVNDALAAKGHNVELVRGRGYYYFSGPDAASLKNTMVLVPRIVLLSPRQFVEEFEDRLKESR
jgi:hypothetical protein